ncbi:MAG: hypothetical protein ACI9LO_000818 [Planctomycetota bacterium]|jgi:hypothetical protein
MVFKMNKKITGAMVSSLMLFSTSAFSSGNNAYHVTITNLTNASVFTPILVASHRKDISLFELGASASPGLTAIAEGGDTSVMEAALAETNGVVDVQNSGGPLLAGASVTVIVSANHGAMRVSVASMILPTNDGFIGLDSAKASKKSVTYYSPGYDAGTEANDEWCANIPGPQCHGAGASPGDNPGDEGFVHIHRGIHGVGSEIVDPAVYDWRNPVAKITITRVSGD